MSSSAAVGADVAAGATPSLPASLSPPEHVAFSRSIELGSAAASPQQRVSVTLALAPYPLRLRTAFGTSHSSSTQRNNALLTVTLQQVANAASEDAATVVSGVGEAGMPPRKTGCYELTYAALLEHMAEWSDALAKQATVAAEPSKQLYDPFASLPAPLFAAIRSELASGVVSHPLLPGLLDAFRALDGHLTSRTKKPSDAAFLCVAEAALMDAWGQLRRQQLCQMIGTEFDDNTAAKSDGAAAVGASAAAGASSPSLPAHIQPRSFYTLGMDSLETMLSNLHFGLRYTPLIKIKCDADIPRTEEVLRGVLPILVSKAPVHGRVSLDANSAWPSPEVAFEFLDMLTRVLSDPALGLPKTHSVITMVEQPYPLFRSCPSYVDPAGYAAGKRMQVVDGQFVPLDDAVVAGWAEVARAFGAAGLPIYADESICCEADVRALRDTLQGVNIKLEKTGGYRAALSLLHACEGMGVRVWLGSMVGSGLASSQAAHLLPLAGKDCWGDLDGSLLTSAESDRFDGGMIWAQEGTGAIKMAKGYGTACTFKKQQQQ